MIKAKITTQGLEISAKLQKGLRNPIQQAVFDVAALAEMQATQNIQDRVYAKPSNPFYTRTGRALGGRLNRRISNDKRVVENDTRLKRQAPKPNAFGYTPEEPKEDYSKYLNARTGFWDEAVDTAVEQSDEILKKLVDKFLTKL